ncbi:MAG: hypothetical protein RI988_2722 [Pseudomonadota bacterium]|jgi:hypothetical protein
MMASDFALPRTPSVVTPRPGVVAWIGAALVLGLWLVARPYLGVRHDGVLYLAQTLQHLYPGLLDRDVFFAHGSQDRFTLFSDALALAQRAFGLAGSQLVMLAVSHAAVLVIAAWLVQPLARAQERWLALASLAVMSHFYGGHAIFAFTETFVTARTLAEPLALLALALWLAGRRAYALVALLGAGLTHPLVALPVAVVGWCLLVLRDRRWAALALAAPLLLVPAGLGLAPFDGLLTSMDGRWLTGAQELSPHLYLSLWRLPEWMVLAMDACVLAAVARGALGPALAVPARAVLMALALLLGVSWLGADVLHNQLITALQLWRVQWLAHLLALLLLPALVWRLWSAHALDRLAALTAALAATAINGTWEVSWALALAAAGALVLRARGVALRASLARALVWAMAFAVVVLSATLVARNLFDLRGAGVQIDVALALWAVLKVPTISLGVAALLLHAADSPRGRVMVAGVALALLAGGALSWDRRSDWTRHIEQSQPGQHPFSRHVPPDAQVFWPEELTATWAMLGRPSYFTFPQAAGIVFHRETAQAFERRHQLLRPMMLQRELCMLLSVLEDRTAEDAQLACLPGRELLDDLCAHAQAPDFLVLPAQAWGTPLASWTFQGAERRRNYYLYRCRTHA